MITLSGYQITEELFESPNSLVFRGYREVDNRSVILKMLKQAYPTPEKIAWFKREYEITRSFSLEGVVKPYSLETDQRRWIMVLEDFGGESLVRLGLARKLTLVEFLQLAIQATDILGQVHQQHIMHKDVNPSNVVLNPATSQLKFIDFGIATALSREKLTIRNPNTLEGTLAYISPEQTGRMNRDLDYRTDYYSLGITFYELLTGQLPFQTADAMELVHAHIAKQPLPPHDHNADIPRPLSDIVLKLMAKNAEDRYRSAYGLKADLEECLRQWQNTAQIEPFLLGQHDLSDRLQIPQKLYGREREIKMFLTTFERAAGMDRNREAEKQGGRKVEENHKSEMMLVSGPPGIGKTALVQEIYKPITRHRGYFIAGKFDQLQRNIPYASLAQAFRTLMHRLLTESEAQIAAWREKLLTALGRNGQVIIEVVPELELIIGPQPAVPDLPPAEAQNRFNLVFQNFVRVFTRPEHPLVLFLDDLQWADAASLQLLKLLITAPNNQYLFIIGAYRDNEVSAGHPLILTLEEIQQYEDILKQITLKPLALSDVNQFVADMLYCAPQTVSPLAELVRVKTDGNPFFMIEFLKSLYAEELLTFVPPSERKERKRCKWYWDLEQIQARAITDNVVELMAGKARKLEKKTQQVLKLAACIGNQFDLQTLAIIYKKSPRETAIDLWPALVEGLVLPLNDAYKLMDLEVQGLADEVTVEYKFAHDRIQQAAYSLIPETDKQTVHRQIGQLLLRATRTEPEKREQKIFDIVNQLNLSRGLIEHQSERDELAELNLIAGRKAKASAAYQPAFNYLQIGLELLTSPLKEEGESDDWERQYNLTLALHVETAEVAYLNADFEQTEWLIKIVLQQAKSLLDKVRAYEVQILAYIGRFELVKAMETGLQALKLLDILFPEQPSPADIMLALQETQSVLADRQIEALSDLPDMTEPTMLAGMRILKAMSSASYLVAPVLFPVVVCKQVDLSVKHGNTAEAAFAYALYGLCLCGITMDIESGYRFGKLALSVLERLNAKELRAKTLWTYGLYIKPWKEHVRETLPLFLEAYHDALETGDIEYASYLTYIQPTVSYHMGKELTGLAQEMALASEVIEKLKQERPLRVFSIRWQAALNLLGQAAMPWRLAGEVCDDEKIEKRLLETNDTNGLGELHLNKFILNYLFQEYPRAVEDAAKTELYLDAIIGYPHGAALFHFYDSLSQLALFLQVSKSEQTHILEKVRANQEKMRVWAQHAPMNFLHKSYLVEAERARVLGNDQEARDYYDRAIELAHEHEYLNEEALAYELAARFYLEREQTRIAGYYLRDAHYAYQRWGAVAKVKDLEEKYPQLLAQAGTTHVKTATSTTSTTNTKTSSALDLTSVLKASQAISGEIELDKLLTKLMSIVIENAGAQRGYLVLRKNGHWVIEAEGTIETVKTDGEPSVTALQSIPVETSADQLSPAIVNYVARTGENVVLNDAAQEGLFTQDPYVIQNQPKSVLCTPLINQGKLTGMLYLENNLTTGAFTADRLEVLKLLSAQAAISIENASLYSHQVALTTGYSRFVPPEFLRFLSKESIVEVKLGDHVQQEMAVLFSDIRSFTTLSETMTPQENFNFVNAYFRRVSPVIRQHKGIIVKYLGDGMMAVFPRDVEDALNAAIAKVKQVDHFNQDRQQRGEVPIRIGVGIHTGKMTLGTVGEPERMQSDFLSDAVNLTARLEGLTKLYGASIVISQEALNRIKDPTQYQLRFLDRVQVKGRLEAVAVFEIFGGEPEEVIELKRQTKTKFEEGLTFYYGQQFAAAGELFKDVLRHNPDDQAAKLYLERSEHYLVHGAPADWAGVRVLHEK